MADKSFGVKELNLLNASGTPTVTSPNNLNLNANTVAISTSATVGNNLTVSGQINVGSNIKIGTAGVVTATSFVGSGSGLTGVASTDPSNVQATWKLGGGSGSGFTFTGPGQDGSEGNPDIYLVRGQRYLFDNTVLAGNHPFEFRNAANTADYTDGVSGAQNGLQYLNVQHDAPARLKYRCTIHTTSMLGDIYIIGGPEVISGVVTATTFVGALTGTASGNAVLTGSTNNQLVTVTGANAITGESGLTFDGSTLSLSPASSNAGRVTIFGSEGQDARLSLVADEGDDHIDQYNIRVAASDNRFYIDQFESGAFQERFTIANGGETLIQGDANPCLSVNRGSANTTNINIKYNGSTRAQISAASAAMEISAVGASTPMKLFTNGSERFQIGTDGNATISDGNLVIGTSGHGIDFHNYGSGTNISSNLLDDYEEGSAVPDFANADNSIVTVNRYTYTKVGRLVHFEAKFTVGSNNDGSGFGFTLPVAQGGSRETVIPAISTRSGTTTTPFAFVVNANQSYAYAKALDGFSSTNCEYLDFAGDIILVSGTYEST